MLIVLLFFPVFNPLFAQKASAYNITTGTSGSLKADKNGNQINLANAIDLTMEGYQFAAPFDSIGFPFVFMGRVYTHLRIGHNGMVGLAVANTPWNIITSTAPNKLTRKVVYPPTSYMPDQGAVLAAFWDDMRTANVSPTTRKLITGTAPNRCLVIEWNVTVNASSTTATQGGDATFQARLYESTGELEYVYGNMNVGPSSGNVTASVGFTAGEADNQFLALKNLSTLSFTSLASEEPATQMLVNRSTAGTIAGLHAAKDGERRYFRFQPPVLTGNFSNITIQETGATAMRISWNDNFTNKTHYTLYHSTDNITFAAVTDLPANTTSYMATNLEYGKRHYWKVTAFTEGSMQTSSIASDSTRCNLKGSFSIGKSGYFTSIGQAFEAIGNKGMTGSITLELLKDYNSTVEAFPLTFPKKVYCRTPDYTVFLRPAADVTNLEIANTGSTPLLIIDSADNIILDGRPGGTGTLKALTLTGRGTVILMQNASDNIIRYLNIRSDYSSQWAGAITMAGTLGKGCDNNIFDQCNFSDNKTMPRLHLSSITSNNIENSNNQVTGCNFYNFTTWGINLEKGNKAWLIKSNSFYATKEITADSTDCGIIAAYDNEKTVAHLITENYFGGSAPHAEGNPMKVSAQKYYIISSYGDSRIIGNTFKKISTSLTSRYVAHKAVYIGKPKFNNTTDTIRNNTFGGSNIADSISFSNNTGSTNTGIEAEINLINAEYSESKVVITGNTIQNTRLYSSYRFSTNFSFINSSYSKSEINDNQIGTPSDGRNCGNFTGGRTFGIFVRGSMADVNNNLITRLHSAADLAGIYFMMSYAFFLEGQVSGNTISHLTGGYDPAYFYHYNVCGIYSDGMDCNGISKNKIYSLTAEGSRGTLNYTYGIYIRSGYRTPVSGNYIHSLSAGYGSVYGISAPGVKQVDNNIIRLGLDSMGNMISTSVLARTTGIEGGTDIIHNTVYIGGNTAVDSGTATGVSASGNFYNNIVVVKRSFYISGNGRNNIITGNFYNPGKYNNNVYYGTGKGTVFSDFNLDTFDKWRSYFHADTSSVFAEPNFILPDGPAAQMNLHLASPTPAEGKGNTRFTTTADFDGNTRTGKTPVDIGAYAVTGETQDNRMPFIIPDSVPGHHIDSLQIIRATISDETGVDTSAGNKPRIWFRKFYPNTSEWYSLPGQITGGNIRESRWQFPVNYATAGLPVTTTDSIECYIVARDASSFRTIGSAPFFTGNHTHVSTQDTLPLLTFHYKISGPLADTMWVGKGQTFTSLTNELGAFQAINQGIARNKGVIVAITSDLDEKGTYGLNYFPSNGGTGFLKIITTTPVVKVITITSGNPLIKITGSSNITFDGSVNGAGRYLRLINSFNKVIYLDGFPSNKNITIQNLVSETSSYDQSNISIYSGDTNIIIRNCEIKGATGNPGNTGQMYYGIVTGYGARVTVIGNEISNFARAGIYMDAPGDSCVVQNNHLFNSYHRNTYSYTTGIGLNTFLAAGRTFSGGHIISGNYVGGSAPYCKGEPWEVPGNYGTVPSPSFIAIMASSSPTQKSQIYNNTVRNITIGEAASMDFWGISTGGLVEVKDNMVGNKEVADDILVKCKQTVYTGTALNMVGISVTSDSGAIASGNTVANMTASTDTAIAVRGLHIKNVALTQKNTIINITANGSQLQKANNYSIAGMFINTSSADMVIRQNIIHNIHSTGIKANKLAAGMLFNNTTAAATTAKVEVARNQISNITNQSITGGDITGIQLEKANYNIANNQITLSNADNVNAVTIKGIGTQTADTVQKMNILFNSICISGNTTNNTGRSYAVLLNANRKINKFLNNLLYNGRTGNANFALGVNMPAFNNLLWPAAASDYNFMVTADSSTTIEQANNTSTLRVFKKLSGGDASTFAALAADVPKDSLFQQSGNGTLLVNTSASQCWYINGKGLPIDNIGEDFYNNNVRSTAISTGPVDIGAEEFTPAADPQPLLTNGRHSRGGSDTLSLNGRIAAVIEWEDTGTLPELGKAMWYSGIWPNDTTNNGTAEHARFMSGFWKIPATGGNGYKYSITFFYDSAMLGKIQDAPTMVINKKQSGIAGSWQAITPTVVNTIQKTITVRNLTSFSEFTATDASATLHNGVQLPDLYISKLTYNTSTPVTGDTVTMSFTISNKGKTSAGSHKVSIYLSADTVLTPGKNKDTLLTTYEHTSVIESGAEAEIKNNLLTIPCNLASDNYTVFIVVNGNNTIKEADTTNNISRFTIAIKKMAVTITQTDTTICAATLPLSATGATSYSWLPVTGLNTSTGATVQATPSTSVTYIVTGSRGTCTATDSVRLTVYCEPVTPEAPVQPERITQIKCTPNPTNGLLTIAFTLSQPQQVSIIVTNNAGIPVYRNAAVRRTGTVKEEIDLRGMQTGLYYVRIIAENDTAVEKVLLIK
ncbi:hypothetical protein GCM10011379_04530 [Filimonas zeae]|uniref:Fibronectin type-III domain-containing protein n=1 Tax=Filimonas zeae TaxID=1737353 RepID=A0A917INQ1_9BACT|nr:hypothetical protein GCM10011379_04530 [Filimonas zeae]